MKYPLLGLLLLASGAPAMGQDEQIPDPARVSVPDLHVDDSDLGDERKFFFLHKDGISFADAYRDLTFCSRYIARGAQRSLPDFVPWRRYDPALPMPVATNYGLIGLGIAAIIDGPINRSVRQARLMRCMLPRGYARYRTSETLWKQVNGPDIVASTAIQAKIASGPIPPTPRTLP